MGLDVYKSKSEEKLIVACIDQNGQAQRELYEKFAPKMYPVCLRYIKDQQAVDDVLITGFMKVFQKIDTYKGTGSLEGWIRKIMVNQSLGYLRKNKNLHLAVDIEQADTLSECDWQDTQLEAKELLQMVQNLPAGYRTVFNLFAIEGYSHQEIAAELGINENTSKSQLSRARALLQKQLVQNKNIIENKFKKI